MSNFRKIDINNPFFILPWSFIIGVIIGLILVYLTGFYVESWGMGNDYFFIDWVNMDYSLTGGL